MLAQYSRGLHRQITTIGFCKTFQTGAQMELSTNYENACSAVPHAKARNLLITRIQSIFERMRPGTCLHVSYFSVGCQRFTWYGQKKSSLMDMSIHNRRHARRMSIAGNFTFESLLASPGGKKCMQAYE